MSAKDYGDYEFILHDVQQFVELPPDEQLKRLRDDPWSAMNGINLPNGSRLPLSQDGNQRFFQIATRGLKNIGTAAQDHRIEQVVEAVKEELSTQLAAGKDLDPTNAHDVFTDAVKKLRDGYLQLTYYVPCSVVVQRTPTSFSVGPVTFFLRDEFLKHNEEAIRRGAANFKDSKVVETVLMRTQNFYSEYQWIASITVPRCDADISRRRAHAGIQKALDVFKLVVGSQRASHVKQAYDVTLPQYYAELVSSSPGSFSLRLGGKLQDAVLNDSWYEQVKAAPAWTLLHSILLNYWNAMGNVDEIQTRFMDALAWHSDAISEPDLGARIVKFWTAIERVLTTSRGNNISARVAVLSSKTSQEFDKNSKELSAAYQRRSDVVHGSANRSNEAWYSEAATVSEAASQTTLFQYLYAIPQIHRVRGSANRQKLQIWLKGLDNLAGRFRAQIREASQDNP